MWGRSMYDDGYRRDGEGLIVRRTVVGLCAATHTRTFNPEESIVALPSSIRCGSVRSVSPKLPLPTHMGRRTTTLSNSLSGLSYFHSG